MRRVRVIVVLLVLVLLAAVWIQQRGGPAVAEGSALVVPLEGRYVEAA